MKTEELIKSTISYLSWEAYTDKPEWILELFEQALAAIEGDNDE